LDKLGLLAVDLSSYAIIATALVSGLEWMTLYDGRSTDHV